MAPPPCLRERTLVENKKEGDDQSDSRTGADFLHSALIASGSWQGARDHASGDRWTGTFSAIW